MLTTRDFHGQEFYVYCQQQFDEARRFLKNCGRPKDEADRSMIDHHKVTAKVFGGLLDMTDAAKEIHKRNELAAERDAMLRRVAAIDAYLRPNAKVTGAEGVRVD